LPDDLIAYHEKRFAEISAEFGNDFLEQDAVFLHIYSSEEEYYINLLMFRKIYQTLVSSFGK
jgi:hypothetical protein